ncbi:MAG: hypothetical protein DWQ36_08690 [Acidobacteria bacterium]|nr:MAG: hypothetical protein DWQ30_22710 [Acidobacteriota bacterium]REK08720.1 MAG: hypothetical protein DWQ36_08690 [Acidobacteriota bacterium]
MGRRGGVASGRRFVSLLPLLAVLWLLALWLTPATGQTYRADAGGRPVVRTLEVELGGLGLAPWIAGRWVAGDEGLELVALETRAASALVLLCLSLPAVVVLVGARRRGRERLRARRVENAGRR